MAVGRIVRAIAGFFFVEATEPLEPAGSPDQIIECSVRGRLKQNSDSLLVGDRVELTIENGRGVITGVKDRTSVLKRPYIANVDLLLLVFAHQNPDPSDILIARFLVLAEASRIPYLLIFNKTDLVEKGKGNKTANNYIKSGYQVICTSVPDHLGKVKLIKAITGKTAVLSGPSGVGKSALLNLIRPHSTLRTGELSQKIGRGKHTTREVQLLKVKPDTYLADTPGFSQIGLEFIEPLELAGYFPDFKPFFECKFTSCQHVTEPECGIKAAVSRGEIPESRYQVYLELLDEVTRHWHNRYR